jgi:putative spermidine/putrescine transport system permease protein
VTVTVHNSCVRSTVAFENNSILFFLSTARTGMLPIRMWGMMESTLDVRIAAIAGVLVLATLILMILIIVMDRTGLTKRISA